MEHWDNDVPVVLPIAGTPSLGLRVDKPRGRLTLRAPLSDEGEIPGNTLTHVAVNTVVEDENRFIEISTTDPRVVVDGYAMLMAVADRIQLDGFKPLDALDETLKTWASILSTRTRLTAEAEVGLFGELLIVRALLETGAADAIAWRGGFGEEHDFGFSEADAEVKTTSGERRHHWIHGLTQLVPTGETPLWLLSLQITRGGDEQGETLPELIGHVSALADAPGRARIHANLAQIGWKEEQLDLFEEQWRLRTVPLALRVDDDFPRLTPAVLVDAGVDTSRLRQVSYEVDLTDQMPSPSPPPTVTAIVEHLEVRADG
jgi:hypothetical protein